MGMLPRTTTAIRKVYARTLLNRILSMFKLRGMRGGIPSSDNETYILHFAGVLE